MCRVKIDKLIAEASELPWEANLHQEGHYGADIEAHDKNHPEDASYIRTVGVTCTYGGREEGQANAALIEHMSKVAPLYRELVLDKQRQCQACGYTDADKDILTRIEELEHE